MLDFLSWKAGKEVETILFFSGGTLQHEPNIKISMMLLITLPSQKKTQNTSLCSCVTGGEELSGLRFYPLRRSYLGTSADLQ